MATTQNFKSYFLQDFKRQCMGCEIIGKCGLVENGSFVYKAIKGSCCFKIELTTNGKYPQTKNPISLLSTSQVFPECICSLVAQECFICQ